MGLAAAVVVEALPWDNLYGHWEGSLGAASGLVASGSTPLIVSSSLIGTSACFASLEGLLGEGMTSAGLPLLGSVSLEAVSTWELGETEARIAGG